jgi:hypothetical protein
MAAPEGNQYAVGHGKGRPRTYDRDYIREQLDLWARKPTSLILAQFSDEYDIPTSTVMDFAREEEDFRATLNIARNRLASRREVMLHSNSLHQAGYNRYQSHYDGFLKIDEREDIEHAGAVKHKIEAVESNKPININIIDYSGKKTVQELP